MTSEGSRLTLEAVARRLEEMGKRELEYRHRVADLEQEIARLRAERATEAVAKDERQPLIVPVSGHGRSDGLCPPPTRRTSRRRLLQVGGAAAAAGMAAAATNLATHARTAQATALTPDTVNPWTTSAFTADAETVVTVNTATYTPNDILQLKLGTGSVFSPLSGSQQAALAAYDASASGNQQGVYATSPHGMALQGVTDNGTGVVGLATGQGYGVLAFCDSATGTAMRAEATAGGIGIFGDSTGGPGVIGNSDLGYGVFGQSTAGYGISGLSTNSIGGYFTGGRAPLRLGPAGAPGAPSSGTHDPGELYVDSNAVVWVCSASGTPGSWVRLAGVARGALGGAITFLASPIRIVDTRGNGAPITNGGVPLAGGSTLVVQVTGTRVGGISVPAGASAVVGNLTALPFANGDLTIWEDGLARPNVSNLNYTTGINVANYCMAALSPAGKVDIFAHVGTTHVIFDVTGYIP